MCAMQGVEAHPPLQRPIQQLWTPHAEDDRYFQDRQRYSCNGEPARGNSIHLGQLTPTHPHPTRRL